MLNKLYFFFIFIKKKLYKNVQINLKVKNNIHKYYSNIYMVIL